MTLSIQKIAPRLEKAYQEIPADVQKNIRIISDALAIQEANGKLKDGFATYVLGCNQLLVTTASLRSVHKDLDRKLQRLSKQVQMAYEKIVSSELLEALQSKNFKAIDNILQVKDLNRIKLPNGLFPLHYLIQCGNYEMVDYLLKTETGKASLFLGDSQGLTAVDLAYLKNDKKMISLVLGGLLGIRGGVSNSTDVPEININEFRNLFSTAQQLKFPPVSLFAPMQAAVFFGELATVQKLVQTIPSKNRQAALNQIDNHGMTLVQYAALNGKKEVLEWLVKNGATIDPQPRNGIPALHMAALSGSRETMAFLLDRGISPNSLDALGRTALHFAIIGDQWGAARVLVKKGANPSIQTTTMETTPLTLLQGRAMAQAALRDPLKLDLSSLFTFGAFTAATISRYLGHNTVGRVFSVLPIFATWFVGSRNSSGTVGSLARYATLPLLGSYLGNNRVGQMAFEGIQAGLLGKTLIEKFGSCWKNFGMETYRPLRNIAIYTANFLFSLSEFSYTSGLTKEIICKFGNRDQCFARDDLHPQCEYLPDEILDNQMLENAPEQLCKKYYPYERPLSCKQRMKPLLKDVLTQCQSNAKHDARLIMGFGGYNAADAPTLDSAKDNLFKDLSCENVDYAIKQQCSYKSLLFPDEPCEQISQDILMQRQANCDKVRQAYHTLRQKDIAATDLCAILPPNLEGLADLEKINALNPSCDNQAKMILGCDGDSSDCRNKQKALIRSYHPDKCAGDIACEAAFSQISKACLKLTGAESCKKT